MTHAYSELYLDDAMENMGEMLDYAINDCGFSTEAFWNWFIGSGISEQWQRANPKYIVGMSGVELVGEIVFQITGDRLEITPVHKEGRSREYWAGWIMAYYQWYRRVDFSDMMENGLSPAEVVSMYVLHEADPSKFVETADRIMDKSRKERPSKLSRIRKARGLTQQELSRQSGVSLRMIQLYEQRQNDINRSQARVVLYLARILGCEIEDLLE